MNYFELHIREKDEKANQFINRKKVNCVSFILQHPNFWPEFEAAQIAAVLQIA